MWNWSKEENKSEYNWPFWFPKLAARRRQLRCWPPFSLPDIVSGDDVARDGLLCSPRVLCDQREELTLDI
jgi:hypothetical protein